MTQQPEALRLADYLTDRNRLDLTCDEAAAELRRLHEENERLKTEIKTEQRLSFRTQVHTLEAALRQAVEALEDAKTFTGAWPAGSAAITAAKQALEGA